LSGITTNLLPESDKNLDSLADIIDKKALVSYIVLSDFDADVAEDLSLPQATSLIGL
jgi:peroxiredoxin